MRRATLVLVPLAVVGATALAWRANAPDTDCPTTLDFRGTSYTAHHVTEEVGGHDLGVGAERGCGDDGPWSQDVAVTRIPGVDPRTALATPVSAELVYLARDVRVDELPGDLAELLSP